MIAQTAAPFRHCALGRLGPSPAFTTHTPVAGRANDLFKIQQPAVGQHYFARLLPGLKIETSTSCCRWAGSTPTTPTSRSAMTVPER